LDNFTFNTLKLNDKSTWDTLLIAVYVFIVFSIFVWVIDSNNLVSGGLRSEYTGSNDPILAEVQTESESNTFNRSFIGRRNISVATVFPGVVFR
jgi:hypothetical protein